ncbi:MAG: insulinase family protein [Oscillospiraceae bacterium]|jgi:predicted Zn-dependent peptidase|nr:insulinase family protein [Oscillospiraceae bacterium]
MYEKEVLKNGVRLICEPMDSVRSAAVGFWVGSGSRHEPEGLGGISHALEHMVFKGTQSRTAARIAEEMDAIGGQVNAFTTKELTAFYARALDSHMDTAIELLGDIFFSPRLSEGDWQTERGVILEEIGMYEDSPEDLVGEELFAAVYKTNPLGRPILGRAATLNAMTAADMASYRRDNYTPGRLVVSLAGRYSARDRDSLAAMLEALPPRPEAAMIPGEYTPAFTQKQKPIEQNHLCLGFPSLPAGHPERYTLQVLNGILGSGMSSRLFQTVREQNGLCYSVYSFTAAHADTGVLGVYTALGKETEKEALRLSLKVIGELREKGPTPEEVDRVREQIKANVLMGLESTSSRMHHLGQSELLMGKISTPDEIIERYDAVTREGILNLAGQILDTSAMSFSAVGNVEGTDYRQLTIDN